jgi:TetR/AcrR family tetracycline transcriptional repressor
VSSSLKSNPKTNPKIDRDVIVDAAFAVLQEKGLDGLSLRVLAAHLDVQAPALYWHVRNKAELIGRMAATFGAIAAAATPADDTWAARLIAYGQALRQAMLQYRDSARLCAMAQPIEDPDVNARRLAAPLIAAGLDAHRALRCQSSIIAYTLGWVIYEQSQPMHEYLAHMIDFSESFDSGLLAMVRGFAAEVDDEAKARAKRRRKRRAQK